MKCVVFVMAILLGACRTDANKQVLDFEDNDVTILDFDGDGYLSDEDCDDSDPGIHPGALEICDGIDNDCDGLQDEDVTLTFYNDADGDGFGDADAAVDACEVPEGHVPNGADCDDADSAVFPGAPEDCDGIDSNCDGEIDNGGLLFYADKDGDGYGDPTDYSSGCEPAAGEVSNDLDCDDTRSDVNPGAMEVCDDIDNDCDLDIDENVLNTYYVDFDLDGYGDPSEMVEGCELPEGASINNLDCDDIDTMVNPGADEICDTIDNDCDAQVDEAGAVDGNAYYVDADGDGFGSAFVPAELHCQQPAGFADNNMDCNDSNPGISPVAVEFCNGFDDDCDNNIDESDAVNANQWYADTDADGYGDPSASTPACFQPANHVQNALDCDDANPAVSPAATEVCDGVDNNCNQWIDDDDPAVLGQSLWYIDFDFDGFGTIAFQQEACLQPGGYVANADDCNDLNGDAYPGAVEYCNSIDDNCDGVVDEDSAVDAAPYYADSDFDGYGNPLAEVFGCSPIANHVLNNSDCDDDDATIYPGAMELYDGLDNDCDGDIDENIWCGDGSDGDQSFGSTFNINQDSTPNRSHPDGVNYVVIAINGDTIQLTEPPLGFAAGDEILVINLQGTPNQHASVGTFEFGYVAAVNNDTIVLDAPINEVYGETDNANLSGQAIMVQRIPNYGSVSIETTGSLTADPFDGLTGGILAFRSLGDVVVLPGGRLTVSERGYRGGDTGSWGDCDAYQGESYAGLGDGDGDGNCSAYNEGTGQWSANYGGGGAHITGGGGNYAGYATPGDSWNYGSATPPQAGQVYGQSDLTKLFLGSGGGGVWRGGGNPGPGGDGAGIIMIGAVGIEAPQNGTILSLGGSTVHWASGSWTYGAAGGAGGSIWLIAETLELGANAIDADGGLGQDSYLRIGGDGGVGRVRLDYIEINGESFGSTAAQIQADSVANPEPGDQNLPY